MNKDEVDMDNPAYAQQDPHLRINDDEEYEMPLPFRNKYPRRPPLFDSMLNNIRAITKKVEHIKGFKFEMAGALSNNFHLTHSWSIPNGSATTQNPQKMNPMKPPVTANYTLGAQFLGGSIKTPFDQPSFIMTGRMDSTGKLEAAFIKKINEMFNFRLSAYYMNSDPMNSQMHMDLDITGEDYTHTLKWGTGLFSINMMQTIGDRLVLGFEFMSLSERKMTSMSYAFKYALNNKKTFYGQYIGPADQLILAYNHRVINKAILVSELSYVNQTGDTTAILGFRQKFNTSEVIITMNSKWKMSSILSLSGMAYQLKLCAIADYLKDTYKFGYGITLGSMG